MKIMKFMAVHGLDQVGIERRAVQYTPAITPEYLMRDLPSLPRLYGSWEPLRSTTPSATASRRRS